MGHFMLNCWTVFSFKTQSLRNKTPEVHKVLLHHVYIRIYSCISIKARTNEKCRQCIRLPGNNFNHALSVCSFHGRGSGCAWGWRAARSLRRGSVGRDLRWASRMVVPGFNYTLSLATAKFRINRAALSAANQCFMFYETIVHQYGHRPGWYGGLISTAVRMALKMQCEFQGINHIDHIFSVMMHQAFL